MHVVKCGWFVAGVATLVLTAGGAAAAGAEADTPTFTEDVAPILYENCVTCHRAGEVAPMSLITYQETRPWVRSIKNKVMSGEMPPWHAAPSVGRFLNERRLTDAEREIIGEWVDAGAPEGDRAKLPSAPTFAAGWQIGTPDVIIEMPKTFDVPADGTIRSVITDLHPLEEANEALAKLRGGAVMGRAVLLTEAGSDAVNH